MNSRAKTPLPSPRKSLWNFAPWERTQAWDASGLPVVRGKKAISLERQVRIAAGTLVLIGVLLSLLVHPYFALLSGFIGAGLVFAGVTDTCGMGLLLARMPWNQVEATGSACKA